MKAFNFSNNINNETHSVSFDYDSLQWYGEQILLQLIEADNGQREFQQAFESILKAKIEINSDYCAVKPIDGTMPYYARLIADIINLKLVVEKISEPLRINGETIEISPELYYLLQNTDYPTRAEPHTPLGDLFVEVSEAKGQPIDEDFIFQEPIDLAFYYKHDYVARSKCNNILLFDSKFEHVEISNMEFVESIPIEQLFKQGVEIPKEYSDITTYLDYRFYLYFNNYDLYKLYLQSNYRQKAIETYTYYYAVKKRTMETAANAALRVLKEELYVI